MTDHRGVLGTLSRLNPTRAFLGALALGLGGMFLPVPFGPVLLLLVAAALGLLLVHTWPVTPPPLRVARIVILAGVVAIALFRIYR